MPKLDQIVEKIQTIYGDNADTIVSALENEPSVSFRINTLLSKPAEVLNKLKDDGFEIEKGPLKGSYLVVDSVRSLSRHELTSEGKLYIQSLASMIPPILLDPNEEEVIADLCAAPGSKTTQLAALSNNKASITAVEKHPVRLKKLQSVLTLQNAKDVTVLQGDSFKLAGTKLAHESFDKVLVDAPCSNEGYITLSKPKSYAFWNKKKYKDFAWVQKGLLMAGYRLLKQGGTMVYSTCTFSVEENEMVVSWLLDKVKDVQLVEPRVNISNTLSGLTSWKGKPLHPAVSKTLRILPNKYFRGFYVAVLKKTESNV